MSPRSEERRVGKAGGPRPPTRWPRDWSSDVCSSDLAHRRKAIRLAGEDALSKGITTFEDMGEPFEIINLYRRLAKQGKLPLRLYALINDESNKALAAHVAEIGRASCRESGWAAAADEVAT